MQLQVHQVIVSRVERRHEMRHDGDGNEENVGVRDRGLGGIGFWSLGGRGRMENIVACREET